MTEHAHGIRFGKFSIGFLGVIALAALLTGAVAAANSPTRVTADPTTVAVASGSASPSATETGKNQAGEATEEPKATTLPTTAPTSAPSAPTSPVAGATCNPALDQAEDQAEDPDPGSGREERERDQGRGAFSGADDRHEPRTVGTAEVLGCGPGPQDRPG